ncbi:hypothetical protein ES332_A13G150700v1 [Gossypium tomentosum]|uniref:Retrovirus-related Pol polyprotein from transposon TNT 1-94-like beta-barrel domain-containing protein n=1 Tax=Gossypium tomentosum TaxID=34277 RepID=A0A5D2MLI8_GOSTO|nr:hypothetical protein ES332_A13G150700v1 [Gossypium tomentosum]
MTHSSQKFVSYTPFSSNRKITIADGSVSTVAGQSDIAINKALTLSNVLHIPKLFTNILSIQKITKGSNCSVVFYPNRCVFQKQSTRRIIRHAKEVNGLYYLEESSG